MGNNYLTNLVESFRFEEASGTPVGSSTGHTLSFQGAGTAPGVTEGPSITDRSRVIDTTTQYMRVNSGEGAPWSIRKGNNDFTLAFRYFVEAEAPIQSEYENQHIFEESDGVGSEGVKIRAFGIGSDDFGLVGDFYNSSSVPTTKGGAGVTAIQNWQTGFAGYDSSAGVVFVKLNDNAQQTGAMSPINETSSVDMNLGFYDIPANPDFKLLGRLAEFTWWNGRVLTEAEMTTYINGQEKVPFAQMGDFPPSPAFTFPDLSSISVSRNVPAREQYSVIPKGDSAGALSSGHAQVFRTALEIQCETPMVCTVLYRLVKESDDR